MGDASCNVEMVNGLIKSSALTLLQEYDDDSDLHDTTDESMLEDGSKHETVLTATADISLKVQTADTNGIAISDTSDEITPQPSLKLDKSVDLDADVETPKSCRNLCAEVQETTSVSSESKVANSEAVKPLEKHSDALKMDIETSEPSDDVSNKVRETTNITDDPTTLASDNASLEKQIDASIVVVKTPELCKDVSDVVQEATDPTTIIRATASAELEEALAKPFMTSDVDIPDSTDCITSSTLVHEIISTESTEPIGCVATESAKEWIIDKEVSDQQGTTSNIFENRSETPKTVSEEGSQSNECTTIITQEDEETNEESSVAHEVAENKTENNSISKSVEEEILPKLIPIKSKRQDAHETEEMPSLIPITKHNNRLYMAQLIERKLQSEIEDYEFEEIQSPQLSPEQEAEQVEETLPDVPSETILNQELEDKNMVAEQYEEIHSPEKRCNDSLENNTKKPIIGTIHKSSRKVVRPTKPPWLAKETDDDSEEAEIEGTDTPEISIEQSEMVADEKETEDLETVVEDEVDMRKKLFSQLQMLKVKRKTEPLVNTSIPKVNVHYEKRIVKPLEVNECVKETNSALGLQIVAVASGVDMNNCEEFMSLDNLSNGIDESEEQGPNMSLPDECDILIKEEAVEQQANEVIINEHLNLPTIKLTKTKDYKKIKGWCNKRLMTHDNTEVITSFSEGPKDVEPSCSYEPFENANSTSESPSACPSPSVAGESSVNIFASNSLDGFLQEKDLNISYHVPNLKSTNHNINLLDACVFIDLEQERKAESKRKSIDNEDSNSSSSFKEHHNKTNDYKPRTLAEKRKMLSKDKPAKNAKKLKMSKKVGRFKQSQPPSIIKKRIDVVRDDLPAIPKQQQPVQIVGSPILYDQATDNRDLKNSMRFPFDRQTAGFVPREKMVEGFQGTLLETDEDDLLIPIDQVGKTLFTLSSDEELPNYIKFIKPEDSKPKDCVTTRLRVRASFHRFMGNAVNVVTRKPMKRPYIYSKITDIPKKWSYDLVPKYSTTHKPPSKPTAEGKTKPSILKSQPIVDYRPGPLCKKQALQVNRNEEWDTLIVNLPKIHVDVIPKSEKAVPPCCEPFVQFETFHITEERADFALSALKGTENQKSFSFPVHYAHMQEKLLGRKKKVIKIAKPEEESPPTMPVIYEPETDEQVHQAIQNVMEKMLDYVDIKQIEGNLLDFDKDAPESSSASMELETSAKAESDSCKLKKMDKVGRALRNLNVQIVELPPEEKPDPNVTCTHEHCKFGCVCHSITNKYPPSRHCGEAKCVFSCICGFEVRHNENGSVCELNEHAIKRFNKEAKRHITARVEREFTQTAIRSSGNTIILGNARESKRTRKYNFKRFEGYHFSFTSDDSMYQQVRKTILESDIKLRGCHVDLVRCDFSDIVPFCLVHNLYDCYCHGLAEYSHNEQRLLAKKLRDQESEVNVCDMSPPRLQKSTPIVHVPSNTPVKTIENSVDNAQGMSARIRGTGEFYRIRNKSNRFKILMARKLKYDTTVDSEVVTRWIILPSDVRAPQSSNKRKQELIPKKEEDDLEHVKMPVLQDERNDNTINFEDPAIMNQNKVLTSTVISKPTISTPIHKPPQQTLAQIGAKLTITGALYSPTSSISQKFSQMISNKASCEFRLLLWSALMSLYSRGDFQIWVNANGNKLRFIITDGHVNLKDGYRNIRNFESMKTIDIKVDFIKWIVTRSLPDNKDGSNILVILKIQPTYWEICGICAKNPQTKPIEKKIIENVDLSTDSPQSIEEQQPEETIPEEEMHEVPKKKQKLNESEIIQKATEETKEELHPVDEKYYKTVDQVVFANGTFASKNLVLFDPTDIVKGDKTMSAALPNIPDNCRWRILKVNSNFKILSFSKNDFSIKCSDIITVMKVAVRSNKTIVINTPEISKNYKHQSFGIYIPPAFQDRIFIGPYMKDEEHGLKTMRFLNNKLINTEEFNIMRGIKNVACTGLWYIQTGRSHVEQQTPVENSNEPVIDLTDFEEAKQIGAAAHVTITRKPAPNNTNVIKMDSLMKGLSRSVLKTAAGAELIPISKPKVPKLTLPMPKKILPKETKSNVYIQPSQLKSLPSILIPTISSNNALKFNHIKLKLPDSDVLPLQEIKEVSQASPAKGDNKIPELIKLPLNEPVNTNITKVDTVDDFSNIQLEDILRLAKTATPAVLDSLFRARLRITMREMGIKLSRKANPICFRVNFGNGIILGYRIRRRINIFWPGDHKRIIEFDDLESTIKWLKNELHEVFICVPTTFKIVVSPVGPAHYQDYMNRGVISKKYFNEICIIGEFGIMRLSEARPFILCGREEALQRLAIMTCKTEKFKKAILLIIDSNDMSAEEFTEKVNELYLKATAAADVVETDSLNFEPVAGPQEAASSEPSEVICIDSDGEDTDLSAEPVEKDTTTPTANGHQIRKQQLMQTTKSLLDEIPKQFMQPEVKSNVGKEKLVQLNFKHLSTEQVKAMLKYYGNRIVLKKDKLKTLPPKSGDR